MTTTTVKTKKIKRENDLVELFVRGIVVGPGHFRPVLILKGVDDEDVLPVWLSNMEFDSMDQENQSVLKSSYFHQVTKKILKEIGLQLEKCCFQDLIGHLQYVDLHFSGEGLSKTVRTTAEECMSLCLSTGTRYFASVEYMDRCRAMNTELLATGFDVPNHPYVM